MRVSIIVAFPSCMPKGFTDLVGRPHRSGLLRGTDPHRERAFE